jgi:hypothetical protein
MSPFQLPDDAIPPPCPCEACAALAIALDADIAARLRVLVAARRVDAVHKLDRLDREPEKKGRDPDDPDVRR